MAKTRNTKVAREACIVRGELYFEDVRQCTLGDDTFIEMLEDRTLTAVRLVSLRAEWVLGEWVNNVRLEGHIDFEMTLRKEKRGQKNQWYAYRRVQGVLHKRFVGQTEAITEDRLIEVARKLPTAKVAAKVTDSF